MSSLTSPASPTRTLENASAPASVGKLGDAAKRVLVRLTGSSYQMEHARGGSAVAPETMEPEVWKKTMGKCLVSQVFASCGGLQRSVMLRHWLP